MEPEGLLPSLQQPSATFYSEPDESNSKLQNLIP
jgi:hypothetical protein